MKTTETKTTNTATTKTESTTFGIELEFTGITRRQAAEILHSYLHSDKRIACHIFSYIVTDQQGREWKIDQDPSITADFDQQNELVTPVLTTADMPILKGLVEALKNAGAVSSDELGAGIHCHISGAGHTPKTIKNLVNIFAAHEDQLFKAFGVTKPDRTEHYCKKVDTRFLEKLNEISKTTMETMTMEQLADIWYKTQGCDFMRDDRYNPSRYHALNLHAFFCPSRFGTIEIRLGQFTKETSMNWTVLEAFIRICLAINELAKNLKTASPKPQADWTSAYSFRCWLLRLGVIGSDTKDIRAFLLKTFKGDKAWKRAA